VFGIAIVRVMTLTEFADLVIVAVILTITQILITRFANSAALPFHGLGFHF
jgi:hypothetical protein